MLRYIIFLSVLILVISCGQNKQEQQNEAGTDSTVADSVAILKDPKNNVNIQTNSFSEIDSSGILMFPLSMGESERAVGSISSSYYGEMPGNSFWNVIFLNSRTNEYHLLSESKMLIQNFDYKNTSDNSKRITQSSRYLYYSVITDDYDKDNKLTDEDPVYLFVSDKEGNNFRQISPAHYDLQNWQFIKSVNKILLTVKKDSDNNNKYDNYDEVTTFEVDIDKGTGAKEIFSTDFKNGLKLLYERDWKRLKK